MVAAITRNLQINDRRPNRRKGQVRTDVSYTQAVKASDNMADTQSGWTVIRQKGRYDGMGRGGDQKNSPEPTRCVYCLRVGHTTSECRYSTTCRRCKGAVHIAVYYPARSPVANNSQLKNFKGPGHPFCKQDPSPATMTAGNGNVRPYS